MANAPGPFPWPVIGNLSMFSGKSHLTFIDLAKKYGDVFSLKKGMTDVVVLNSVDAVREALVEKSVAFAGRPHLQSYEIESEGRKNMAFTDYNPAWKQHSKLMKSALREYASDRNLETQAHEAFRYIIGELEKVEGQAVDLNAHISNLIYNIVCPVAFGVRFDLKSEDFKNMTKRSEELNKKRPLGDIYPSLGFLPHRDEIESEGRKNMAFTDYNPAWKQHSKLMKSALREYASDRNLETQAHEAFRYIIGELEKVEGQAVDLNAHISNLIYNIVCPVAFGVRFDLKSEDFKNMTKRSEELNKKRPLGDIYPSLGFLPHRDDMRDVTDHMIKAQKEAEEDGAYDISALTDTHLRQIVYDVFMGGTETTKLALLWAIPSLAAHPEIQEKVAAELHTVVGRDRLPGLGDRHDTPYTEATVNEVLRMGIPDPLSLPRATTKDTSLREYNLPL
uniref:Uncharacterized protein n=1 Tax=Branchiostoma floridae TaxID=7739 RepID=C3Y793_BRAFL|eukprot:XP_002607711.1 hypothetical protein BRAFLDRAFT_82842 [Branchiostoma floridae]